MSFFDEYKEIGGRFLKAEDKQVLIDNGIPFQVTEVQADDENQYGPRFVAKTLLPVTLAEGAVADNEESEVNIAFPKGTVESRDRMLKQMSEYLEREDAAPVIVKLEKVGRSILLRQA